MKLNLSREWLLKHSEIDDGGCIGVGGLLVDLGLYKKPEDKMEEKNLLATLKSKILDAMRAGETITRDVLRVVVSEVEALQNTTNQGNKPVSDEQIHKIIRGIVESNNLNLSKTEIITAELTAKLIAENSILMPLVPVLLSVEQILAALEPVTSNIKDAEKPTQAMGIAMKLLKSQKLPIFGDDVKVALSQIRGKGEQF